MIPVSAEQRMKKVNGMHKRWSDLAVALCAVLLAAFVLSGCNKQRAELAIKKADSNIKQARDWNAEKFSESQGSFKDAQSALKSSQDALSSKQYSQALSQAQDAVKKSQDALKSAKSRFADQRLEEAKKAVEVAR